MSRGIRINHQKEIAIYAVLIFVAMLSLTIMAPAIKEFIIDRFGASNTEASMFFTLEMLAYVILPLSGVRSRTGAEKGSLSLFLDSAALLFYIF